MQNLLAVFIPAGKFTRKDLARFAIESSNAEFLYGYDVKIYIDEVLKKAQRLIHLEERLGYSIQSSQEKNNIIEEMSSIENWFDNQIRESVSLFKKYLSFSINRDP